MSIASNYVVPEAPDADALLPKRIRKFSVKDFVKKQEEERNELFKVAQIAAPDVSQKRFWQIFKDKKMEEEFFAYYYDLPKLLKVRLNAPFGTFTLLALGIFDILDPLPNRGYFITAVAARVVCFLVQLTCCILLWIPKYCKKRWRMELAMVLLLVALVISSSIRASLSYGSTEEYHTELPFNLACSQILSTIGLNMTVPAAFTLALVTLSSYFILFISFNYYLFQAKLQKVIINMVYVLISQIICNVAVYSIEMSFRKTFVLIKQMNYEKEKMLLENQKSEKLLKNILPSNFIPKVKEKLSTDSGFQPRSRARARSESSLTEPHEEITILFSDIVSFTAYSSKTSAEDIVNMLNQQFSYFDALAAYYKLEKVKTIGDAYFAVATGKDHALRMVAMGQNMINVVNYLNRLNNWNFAIRIGVASDTATLGVVGDLKSKMAFDAYGKGVTLAHLMESLGPPQKVHVTEQVAQQVEQVYDVIPNLKDMKHDVFNNLNTFIVQGKKVPLFHKPSSNGALAAAKKEEIATSPKSSEEQLLDDLDMEEIIEIKEPDAFNPHAVTAFDKELEFHCLSFIFKKCALNKTALHHLNNNSITILRITMGALILFNMMLLWMMEAFSFDTFIAFKNPSLHITVACLGIFIILAILFITPLPRKSIVFSWIGTVVMIMTMFINYVSLYAHKTYIIQFSCFTCFVVLAVFSVVPMIHYYLRFALMQLFLVSIYAPRLFLKDDLGNKIPFPLTELAIFEGAALSITLFSYFFGKVYLNAFVLKKKIEYTVNKIEEEKKQNTNLILSCLPPSVVNRMQKDSQKLIVDSIQHGAVCFCMIHGFEDEMIKFQNHDVALEFLNDVFTEFDRITIECRCQKIKSIQDVYLAVSGLEKRENEDISGTIADLGLSFLKAFTQVKEKYHAALKGSDRIGVKIGLCEGSYVAGVLGTTKFLYDVFGDTVNTASRMSTLGLPDKIQLSGVLADKLKQFPDKYTLEYRGKISVKGKGHLDTYWLSGISEPTNETQQA